jgi:Trk K+ transport system NAD-binding subunit
MIVVGGDALALGTAQELCALQGHHVVVLWRHEPDFARAVAAVGAAFIAGSPDTAEALNRAGVKNAITILALSPDDQLNLHAALLARDASPGIRIVLRQFNRRLARKIEQNLPNCSVLSLAWHSAATYAAAAIDPSCFRALQFPEPDGPLSGFTRRVAESCGVAGYSVSAAEDALSARIVAVDGVSRPEPAAVIAPRAELVVYGDLRTLLRSVPSTPIVRTRITGEQKFRTRWRREGKRLPRPNTILVRLAIVALIVFAIGAIYFHEVFGGRWLDAAYFVTATMTTTGYGDLTPNRNDPVELLAAMLLMLAGITLTGLFIAFGASLLTRVHWVTLQGLRPVHRRGHIVVCGAGSIGSGVIELLLKLGKRLVVVEQNPDAAIVELARERRFELLTGDASRDETLDLCNLGSAHSIVALTNVDTLNLEIALGARARNPTMPAVLRIAEASFAASIARHFEFETTFSVAALAAPAFVGLSRFAGSRGRVAFAGHEFALGEYTIGADFLPKPPAGAIVLAVSRNNDFVLGEDFSALGPGDRVLIMLPLAPFREGKDTLAAAAERFLSSSP